MYKKFLRSLSAALLALAAASPSHAQWAVVDAPAIVQLVQQVHTLELAVATARNQLGQAEHALETMTGNRGMQTLLAGVSRNYLPVSWPQLSGVVLGTGGFPALSSAISNAMTVNAVLTPSQWSSLSVSNQQLLMAGRRNSALQQALAQEALANVSGRFASLQGLIDAIGSARDQKGILDLQARISAELGMLQNEQTKLQVLQQSAQARDAVTQQQERERMVAEHGRFESRFAPVP
jgi:type IV secretion system protein VirB5